MELFVVPIQTLGFEPNVIVGVLITTIPVKVTLQLFLSDTITSYDPPFNPVGSSTFGKNGVQA